MSILEYNGGAVIAMIGKNCVGIASDTRLGAQFQTVATNFPKTFPITDRTFMGLSGLATDMQTLYQMMKMRANMYKLKEERDISPRAFAAMLSAALYERRFAPWFVEPLVAGLDDANRPFITGMDLLGCPVETEQFVVAGTCTPNLHGMCEALWRPEMEPDDLFEVLSQSLLSAVDRDALSGWGAVVHVITPEGVRSRELKCRQD